MSTISRAASDHTYLSSDETIPTKTRPQLRATLSDPNLSAAGQPCRTRVATQSSVQSPIATTEAVCEQRSGSDTATDEPNKRKAKGKGVMPSRAARTTSSSSRPSGSKRLSSSSGASSKYQSDNGDDWSDITEPEERRRVQNRIAQRKFRDKARDLKERHERDTQNKAHAGSSYHVPLPEDLAEFEDEGDYLSGVPWGGININHVVARGHETESRRGGTHSSSRRNTAGTAGPFAVETPAAPLLEEDDLYLYTSPSSQPGSSQTLSPAMGTLELGSLIEGFEDATGEDEMLFEGDSQFMQVGYEEQRRRRRSRR